MVSVFGDYSRDLLRNGIIDFKSGNRESARRYLDRALYMSSDHDVMAEAWFWLSLLADDPVEKRKDLENCLTNDLQHSRARRALAILDGKLMPNEVIDPDHLPPTPEGLQEADTQRFMCPKCGGRMAFSPDGLSMVCEYCKGHQSVDTTNAKAGEKDFIIAMATSRGHSKPLAEQVIHCQGCGAEFILPRDQLSINCVYCGSPYIIKIEKSKDLLSPDGILAHKFDQDHAVKSLEKWVESCGIRPEKRMGRPRGLYLPLWTFEIGGEIDYTGDVLEEQDLGFGQHTTRLIRVSDVYPVMFSDIPIPASRKLSAPFVKLIPSFDLKAIQSYDARYLAGWPAELYDVPMSDASLDARDQAFAQIKQELYKRILPIHLVSASSARMSIQSFRLDLMPVWITEIWLEGRSRLVLIDGQHGTVHGDIRLKINKTPGRLGEFLKDLITD